MECFLEKIRSDRKISQYQLARDFEVRQSTISNWENNRRLPGLQKAINIAKYFNLSVEDIWKEKLTTVLS